jgi:signal transduction histidine kinase
MRIKKAISFIFADDESFSLEHRLFLSAIIVGIIISLIGALINLCLTTSPYAVIMPLVLSLIVIIIYYFVRFKKIVKPFVTPIIIISLFGISAIWIFNGGINGANIMPAFVILILGLVVVPDNTRKYIFFLFLTLNILILLIQFYRPDLIVSFPSETDRWLDNLVTLIYSSFLIFIIIRFMHSNYTQERLKSEESEKKMIQLNSDKDLFISILAHDLKSPFNSILGLSEILAEEIHTLNKDEIGEIAGHINKSARSTFNLIEEILMWARVQQGKVPFKPQKLIFTDICKNVHDHHSLSAHEKKISIDCSIQNNLAVFADVDMIKAVMRNLVSNSIKFTNQGGSVTISSEQSDSIVTISVSDNGIGIDPEALSKLFDITTVLTTCGTAEETGTGFGLLLCKEFVEKHGGRIWCESVVGKGSTFKFTLPLFGSDKL